MDTLSSLKVSEAISPLSKLLVISLPVIYLIVGSSLLFVSIDYFRTLRLRRRLPPGPLPLPLLGNWFDVPKIKPWVYFETLSHRYNSPIVTLWTGRQPMIICNDAWVMSELCETRADVYSSRPNHVLLGDLMGMTDSNQIIMDYGQKYRTHQKLTHSIVGAQAARNHRKIQSEESTILLRDLLQAHDTEQAVERLSCSMVSIVGWGRRIDRMNDPVAVTTLSFMEAAYFCIPFFWFMETVPMLSRLPAWLYGLPSAVAGGAVVFQQYFYALAKEGADSSQPNFSKTLLKYRDEDGKGLPVSEVAGLTQNLLGCGVDATSSALMTCILAICTHPSTQAKAQAELDSVIGSSRLPDFEDESSLPYTSALISEVLRWRTVATLAGFPHAPSRDDIYNGFLMPKGTPITGNLWAIHRNPRDYPEPDEFRPERFLDEKRAYPTKKGHSAFGWGRRRCSGEKFGEQSLFIVIARLLWAFDIKAGIADDGSEIKLDTSLDAYTDSENMRPKPFKARFMPRSAKHEEVVLREAKRAREELKIWDGETEVRVGG